MLGAPMPSLEKHESWGNRVAVSPGSARQFVTSQLLVFPR